MVCGSCGTTIADKAIVCYRCGQPTAIPAVQRAPRPAEPGRPWVLIAVLVLAAAALYGFVREAAGSDAMARVVDAATVLLVLAAVFLAVRRPGRRT